ncbi:hypothetical protein FIBSPDRAFT_924260 [Athelia psychrophila]|uniref:BTB domain-containing protein n=1 Tax=Athelia psychrophila TaxID=1759441 RepID=A0A166WJT0_9AGAM|nr:hypothetical protein FIBSPDRAFT_924260 [Fibularhizoctonia sp. CBS 109695]
MPSPHCSPSLQTIVSTVLSASDEDFQLDAMPVDLNITVEERVEGSPSRVQIDAPFEDWALFKAWKQQREELQAVPEGACPVHERFFLPAQNIFFSISKTLYSVPRAPFEWHSSAFTGKGLTRGDPLILDDVKAAHFDHFLSILYPYAYGAYTANTIEDWTAILHFADEWNFQSIRELAITQLFPIATDAEKIILGRQYAINEWLGDAYLAVCMRDQSLTKEEGRRMQQFGFGDQLKLAPAVLVAEVCARFGLGDSDLPHTGLASTAPEAFLASGLAVTTPLASSESMAIHSAHLGNGQGKSTLDAQVSLPYGGDSVVLPEPAVVPEVADSIEKAREAAALERAEWEKDRVVTERALCAFVDRAQNPLYDELDATEQWSLGYVAGLLKEELAQKAVALLIEHCKQKMYDFITSYKAASSELH